MEVLLVILLSCFFLLLSLLVIVLIVCGIVFIIFQKTDRIYISPFTSCYRMPLYFSVEFKKKKKDVAFSYSRYNGYYYFLGMKGIYKVRWNKFEEISEANMVKQERELLCKMIQASRDRLLKDREILSACITFYNLEDSN